MTETGSGVVYDGRPLDGVEIRHRRGGEIHLRCPMLMRCYRDGTSPLVDGWFATGDLGEVDVDGRLVVHGRRGDMIITGGENVWPAPVEAVLARPPARRRGCRRRSRRRRVGPARRRLDRAHGCVEPADSCVDSLIRGRDLPMYMAPKEIRLVDNLPTTSSGKVRRQDLPS